MKRKYIYIIAITLVVAISAWVIRNYMVKRTKEEQYQQELAQQYDKVFDIVYPLLENYVITLNDRVDSMEVMGKKSMETDSANYNKAFYNFWLNYTHTEKARAAFVFLEEYEYFKNSPVFSMLVNAGEERKKEAEAIQKMAWAGNLLREPYLISYDSLMNATKQARLFISDGIEVLEPHHSENTNIHAWRDIR